MWPGRTQPMLLPESSFVCICFRLVASRICLAKVSYLVFVEIRKVYDHIDILRYFPGDTDS